MVKWIYCPVCGIGTKLMEVRDNACLERGELRIKCRRGGHIIQISGDCQTKVVKESKSA